MRRVVLCVLIGVLTAVVTARALLPEAARAASASDGELYGYNICDISLPITTETAGSAMLADMNGYYLFRTPTAKNEWTGALRGKDLILICADAWIVPDAPGRYGGGALYQLVRGSADISEVYRTDWYQGAAGLSFALLTGVVPTTVDDGSALAYTGRQDIWFPYALARSLSDEGRASFAFVPEEDQCGGLEALGFCSVTAYDGTAEALVEETLGDVTAASRFFAYYQWTDGDGEAALAYLLDELKAERRLSGTAICLLTGADAETRGHLYIYAPELDGASSGRPCSALDVTPTLLNLFGVTYDSRFLSGADIFSRNGETGVVSAVTPLVSLYGSAYSDWVTDAGYYSGSGSIFRQTADCFDTSAEVSDYVHAVARMVYDRYTYAHKAMEYNYFKLALP